MPTKNTSFSPQVVKFGGTSVKSIARIQHVAEIVAGLSKAGQVLMVVSAMGDTTDYLIKLAKHCASEPDHRELDLLLSTGEQVSITLLAIMLKAMGIKARSLTAAQIGIFTESVHSNARIVDINTDSLLKSFGENDVLVVAGFQGVTADGDITTLGRGGSDTTAVALAAAIGAKACDIYTDVDGVFTADPNIVRNARPLERISYDEVVEMARMGAQVIHPRAVDLARQYKITLRVRNTFKPVHTGTTIDGEENMEIYRSVSGVALDCEQASIAILDVPVKPGVAGIIMTELAKKNIMIDMIMQASNPTMGLDSITFTIGSANLNQTLSILEKLKEQLGGKDVVSDPDIAKVSLIGIGLGGQPEIAAKLFTTLGKNKINMKMIAGSERKLTCVVSRKDAEAAVRLIHEAFELA